jgi:hypothetical protein
LLHKLHTGLWVQLLAAHFGHLRRLMSQNGGHEVATTGFSQRSLEQQMRCYLRVLPSSIPETKGSGSGQVSTGAT